MTESDAHNGLRNPVTFIATFGGTGLLPAAPGTWGSLATLPFAWILAELAGSVWLAVAAALIFVIGLWASDRYLATSGEKDPPAIVIDETAGQLLALAAIPPKSHGTRQDLFSFVYSTLPSHGQFPGRTAACPEPLGVMVDDILAGGYALCILGAAHGLMPLNEAVMIDRELFDKANDVLRVCQTSQLTVATVESCTGGLVSAALTDVPGSSSVMDRGFVTYTNEAKTQLVGVPQGLFPKVGAVSEEVAREMAMGGLEQSMADISVAVTGVAGPGQSELKPAGLVHIAAARREGTTLYQERRFQGDRQAVRKASVLAALDLVARLANSRPGARARVAGVDFSGARLAGSKIWISEGWNGADGVEIYRLLPASALPNGDKPMQPALTALVAHLKTLGDSIIGLDFPFSLPRTLIPQKDWETFVRNFPNRFRDADAFRETCRAEACKREPEEGN